MIPPIIGGRASERKKSPMTLTNVKNILPSLVGRIVYGVDFSGAADAGNKIWIARGEIKEDLLLITECSNVADKFCSGNDREPSLMALRGFICEHKDSIFGLDFPFGVPKTLVKEHTWEEFVVSFEDRYKSPEEFRKICTLAGGCKELRRFTDIEAKTPFSPYNLRLYRQTYFGIRDVLAPLIRDTMICVLPMQNPLPGRAWVVEICPASTLKRENLGLSYKGRGETKTTARARILEGIEKTGVLKIKNRALRSTVLENPGGDALDSVIAAFATFKALRKGFAFDKTSPYAIEGWVYV
jgi:hypothetical protein